MSEIPSIENNLVEGKIRNMEEESIDSSNTGENAGENVTSEKCKDDSELEMDFKENSKTSLTYDSTNNESDMENDCENNTECAETNDNGNREVLSEQNDDENIKCPSDSEELQVSVQKEKLNEKSNIAYFEDVENSMDDPGVGSNLDEDKIDSVKDKVDSVKDTCSEEQDTSNDYSQCAEFVQVDSQEKNDNHESVTDASQCDEDSVCANTMQGLDPIGLSDELNDKMDSDCNSELSEGPLEIEPIVQLIEEKTENEKEIGDVLERNVSEEKENLLERQVEDSATRKTNLNVEAITGDKSSSEVQNQDEREKDICIIPDTEPQFASSQVSRCKILDEKGIKSSKELNALGKQKKEETDEEKEKSETISGSKDSKTIGEVNDTVGEKNVDTKRESNETRRNPSRPQRQAAKKAESQIKEIAAEEEGSSQIQIVKTNTSIQLCSQCFTMRPCKYQIIGAGKPKYLCSQDCFNPPPRSSGGRSSVHSDMNSSGSGSGSGSGGGGGGSSNKNFVRKCAQCSSVIKGEEKNLSWETMDYCNEECLGKYQKILGSHCTNCKGTVAPVSLGKYCVRFGYDVKQFCCSPCLEEFKKGLKVCSYCQKDISGDTQGFLAPVGDKGLFKEFCTQYCMERYDQMGNHQSRPIVSHQCAVCSHEKIVTVEVIHNEAVNKLCSEPCFAAFKFVNGIVADQCFMCKKYFDKKGGNSFCVYSDDIVNKFCSKACMSIYILANRKIVPCQFCKVKKYNFDMIRRVLKTGQLLLVCSLNCLTLYEVSASAISSKRVKCDMCEVVAQAQYHLTMSDATIRNFCNYQCVMQFQDQYSKQGFLSTDSTPVPTDCVPSTKIGVSASVPVISSVTSLATNGQTNTQNSIGTSIRSSALKEMNNNIQQNQDKTQQIVYKQQIVFRPPPPKTMCQKSVFCKPYNRTKGVSCRPYVKDKETQTSDETTKPVIIPVPVPIYVPVPMQMYSTPFPVPVPFPLPVPVPVFIPTTRNSFSDIMDDIKYIQEKIPTDPFEAELLMMAEMVASEKKDDHSDSESDDGEKNPDASEVPEENSTTERGFSPEAVDTSTTFGEDMLQMALKMATELEEPADLEAALTPATITPQTQSSMEQVDATESDDDPETTSSLPESHLSVKGKKRSVLLCTAAPPAKRKRASSSVDIPLSCPTESGHIENEKPDANMCLKYTFGVNAWKQWVLAKNDELEKAAASNRKLKLFKTDILQLTADELNYSLCLFVKEVRKPNGSEYAPDTIYYLCLGIQQYLFENGRIDNIFTDPYYEKFTECLDEVAKKFTALYSDSQYIVTRVEEEHLWESKQLGAHSPYVLLGTLMFFNTKFFNLTTVEEHMQLSFSHIMKHWKRNPNQSAVTKAAAGGTRNVLLRYYPPQSVLETNPKKKKFYEQQENEENPLRCSVKLYEFYLSKCPESVKTRNDVFYLLPERSCVPDSPVWYSTMPLGKEPLVKMLHRVKMIKEINIALLTS